LKSFDAVQIPSFRKLLPEVVLLGGFEHTGIEQLIEAFEFCKSPADFPFAIAKLFHI
jgi:hypothetical protein